MIFKGWLLTASERSATSATKATAAEATSSASSTPSGAGAAGARSGYKCLLGVRCHAVHRAGEEDGIEGDIRRRADVPARRVLHDALKRLGPAVLDTQRHGERQDLLERIRWHALQPVGVYPRDEFLQAENLNLGSHSLQRLRRHDPCEQDNDDDRDDTRSNQQPGRAEDVRQMKELQD